MEQAVEKKSKFMSLMKALLVSYAVTAVLLLFLAFLLYKFELGEKNVTMGITVIYILSCFLGGFVLGKATGNRQFLWGMLLGISYGVLLIGVTLLVEHKLDGNVTQLITTLGLCFGGGTLGGMLS